MVEIADAVSAQTWLRLYAPAEPMQGALAIGAQGRSVGLVHWIFHRSTCTVGNYCYLQDLFVATDVRGCGHGRRPIGHVYVGARAAGCSRVYRLTHESNTVAMQLYDRIADKPGYLKYRRVMG